jgi:hypothetical protein
MAGGQRAPTAVAGVGVAFSLLAGMGWCCHPPASCHSAAALSVILLTGNARSPTRDEVEDHLRTVFGKDHMKKAVA